MPAESFRLRVYQVVGDIPFGKVTTYGLIAEAIGDVRASREVGRALAELPDEASVPAHRVVGKDGTLLGGWAFGGSEAQRAMLAAEGVTFTCDGRANLVRHLYDPVDRPPLPLFRAP
jgi:methylated-DNA-protein-cysteine methyltransferase related protein